MSNQEREKLKLLQRLEKCAANWMPWSDLWPPMRIAAGN